MSQATARGLNPGYWQVKSAKHNKTPRRFPVGGESHVFRYGAGPGLSVFVFPVLVIPFVVIHVIVSIVQRRRTELDDL